VVQFASASGVVAIPIDSVPQLEVVPVGNALMSPAEYMRGFQAARLGRQRIDPDVLLALRTADPYAIKRVCENSDNLARFRDLAAAALRDVCDWPYDGTDYSICGYLGYGDRNTATRCITRGRKLWATLAAWPWWALNPTGGRLPNEWWALPRVVETFAAWRDPDRWLAANRASV
jgi:hypothetical protein